jgi:hypothetical protein
LWLQEDVIRALANINEEAAETIREAGGRPCVLNLPVKHLVKIAVGDYVPQATGAMGGPGSSSSGSSDPLIPAGSASMVFTKMGGTSEVDVIQFGLDLVVEAARLPAVIDAICGAGFYTPLLLNYRSVEPNVDFTGYIYGHDPVISVQLQFEGCFLRTEFDALMPDSIKTAIQNGTAKVPGATSGGGTGTGGGMTPAPGRRFRGQQSGGGS